MKKLTQTKLRFLYKQFIKYKGDCNLIKDADCCNFNRGCPFEGSEWECEKNDYIEKVEYSKQKLYEIEFERKLEKELKK